MLAIGGIELASLFASACLAAPADLKDALNVREAACKALGTCLGMHLSSASPPTSGTPLLLNSSLSSPLPSITPSLATSASPNTAPGVLRSGIDPYFQDCSDDQKYMLKEAWIEAGALADAHARWRPPGWFHSGAWQPAQSMYLGSHSRNDEPLIGTGPLKQNINRQHDIHFNAPLLTYAYFYCQEPKVPKEKLPHAQTYCAKKPYPSAYTYNDLGVLWSAHYIILCPRFFSDKLTSLARLVGLARVKPERAVVMETWLIARASVIFHETYHWDKTVTRPPLNRNPEVYSPKEVYDLARNENTEGAKTNAGSWTLAAIALFVQQEFNLRFPPVPKAYYPPDMRSDPSIMKIATERLNSIYLDRMPDWFAPPVVQGATAFKPDMTNVVRLSSIGRMSQNVSMTVIDK